MKATRANAGAELRVAFAGGGTGGHIMPAAAVAEALGELVPGARCLFLGTSRLAEARCRRALAAFEWEEVPAARWNGTLAKVRFAATSARAAVRCRRVLRHFRPHVLVGLGGYSCVVPVLLAKAMDVPTMLLEANAVPGRAVRALGRVVDCVQVQWVRAGRRLKARRVLVSGHPVRKAILKAGRARAIARLGLEQGRLTLLVTGGSQAAQALNETLVPALHELLGPGGGLRADRLQVLHLTGPDYLEEALRAELPPGLIYQPMGFLHGMGDAYAAADLALSRAGGSTLAELTAVGVPSVLVPYPHAADNHQHANAAVLSEAGAARLLVQERLGDGRLVALFSELFNHPDRLAYMAQRARELGRPEAAFTVAAELAQMAGFVPTRAGWSDASTVDGSPLRHQAA